MKVVQVVMQQLKLLVQQNLIIIEVVIQNDGFFMTNINTKQYAKCLLSNDDINQFYDDINVDDDRY